MPVEQRVVGGGAKIGAGKIGGAKSTPAPEPEPEPATKSKKKLVLVVGLVVLLAAGAAWWFLLRPSGAAAEPAEEPTPEKGEVLAVEPVSLNLTDGHYLRLGFSLQLTADAHEAPDPAAAVDHAIALFSGRTVKEISDPKTRDKLRDELAEQLDEVYEGEVMGVYLTNYVTQ
ncbi:flagellar basal body-associated FliL family protein [Cellulomonas sp. DKR-3]|uniref:Flagellar protein FliL n=1 Tax=Cellulomonas fulva TaxID=2835530 RepID=A0ABS5TVA4_9CELL|nr:flagellar basal body-associated FliL family protein [Cellulomonas fulva]MBT0993065.1 flagellar basal body-associated FliL family protein [Cellulomonas fulva]